MAFKGNDGDVVIIKDKKIWTGIAPVRVLAINPTLSEIHKFGLLGMKNEPEYLKSMEIEGQTVKTVRIDIWIKNDPLNIITKASFFIQDASFYNKEKTKCEHINSYGATAWGEEGSIPEYDWFKPVGVRASKKGEADLIKFITTWINADQSKDEVYISDWDEIFKGNFEELTSIVPIYSKKNAIRVLLTAIFNEKDGKYYQDVYTRYFARQTSEGTNIWADFINKIDPKTGTKRNEPKGHYTYALQEFIPPINVPDVSPQSVPEFNNKAEKLF